MFNQLVTKCLTNDPPELAALAMFPRALLTDFEVELTEWVLGYSNLYASPPTVKRLSDEYPLFFAADSADPIMDLYDRTIKLKRNNYTREFLMAHQQEIKEGDDPAELIARLSATLQLGAVPAISMNTFDRSEYLTERRRYNFGLDALDKATGGLVGGDLVYILGPSASGKTTIMEWLAKEWWGQGLNILLISNENPAKSVMHKIDSMVGGWNPLKYRTGEWTEVEKQKVQMVGYYAASSEGNIIIPEKRVPLVSDVDNLIVTYKPDIVAIDGVYLMDDVDPRSSGWQAQQKVSEGLKQLCLNHGTPIVGVIQTNREAEGKKVDRSHIGGNFGYLRDADTMLSITPDTDGKTSYIETLKNRWGKRSGFTANVDHNDMIVSIAKPLVAVADAEW